MLSWSLAFFLIAVLAGILGFTGIAEAAVGIAKFLFFLFITFFVLSLLVEPLNRKYIIVEK